MKRHKPHLALDIAVGLSVQQELSFVETCLPRTMQLADRHRRVLAMRMSGIPDTWPFHDRVLVWLVPKLFDDVAAYHSGSAPSMVRIFQTHQIERLDGDLFAQLRDQIGVEEGA